MSAVHEAVHLQSTIVPSGCSPLAVTSSAGPRPEGDGGHEQPAVFPLTAVSREQVEQIRQVRSDRGSAVNSPMSSYSRAVLGL